MKIRKIKIKNYQVFDDLELDFTDDEGKTLDTIVLAGVNGSGKTSLLELLLELFSQNNELIILNECEIEIEFEISPNVINIAKEIITSIQNETFPFDNKSEEFIDPKTQQKVIRKKILLHGMSFSDREIIEFQNFVTELHKNGNTAIFSYIIKKDEEKLSIIKDDFIIFRIFTRYQHLFLWKFSEKQLIRICYIPSKTHIESGESTDDTNFQLSELSATSNMKFVNSDIKFIHIFDFCTHKRAIEEYIINSIVNELLANRNIKSGNVIEKSIKKINDSLVGMKLSSKLVGITAEETIFESINGKQITIDDLSSGEKQLFYNATYLRSLNLKDSIIMVDEPEMSLHPAWQQSILKLYQNVGEDNQVIVATHSPHIIASVDPKNLFLLTINGETKRIEAINAAKANKQTKGLEPNRIIEEIMGAPLRDYETQKRIDEVVENLRIQPENCEKPEMQKLINGLIEDLGKQDPFIIRLNHQLLMIKRRKNAQQIQ